MLEQAAVTRPSRRSYAFAARSETTRRSGVSPNAAYRHFADRAALLQAVSAAAQGRAAYIGFAQENPGLFRAAFGVPEDLKNSGNLAKADAAGRTPFQILGAVLDELVDTGALPSVRRPNAEFLTWAAVHGLGMLVIDGPLRGLDEVTFAAATERLPDMVDRGL